MKKDGIVSQLQGLKNVGSATLKDLELLGIHSIEQLAQADASELYDRLEQLTGSHQDPCVWDVFAAIIHEAQTGERLSWWHWTDVRKSFSAQNPMCKHQK